MKILILTKKFPYPLKDGEALAIHNLAVKFADRGHDVHMLSMITPKHNYSAGNIPAEVEGRINFQTVYIDTHVRLSGIVKNIFEKTPYHIRRFVSPEYVAALEKILSSEIFDVIQLEGLFLTPYISLLRKMSMAPVVLRSHNIEGRIWARLADNEANIAKKLFLRMQSKKLLRYERKMMSQYNAIIAISLADKDFYTSFQPKYSVLYIPSGVDTGPSATINVQDTHDLYYIGALDWLPNIEGLQWFIKNIFPDIILKHPSVKFHLAGRNAGFYFQSLHHKNIVFYGEVDNAQLFLQDKLLCVVPLLSGSGMKIKIIEAMHSDKFVITTTCGAEGLPEGLLKHLAIAGDEKQFIDAVNSALSDPDETRRKGRMARIYVDEHFNNDKLADSLIDFYKGLK